MPEKIRGTTGLMKQCLGHRRENLREGGRGRAERGFRPKAARCSRDLSASCSASRRARRMADDGGRVDVEMLHPSPAIAPSIAGRSSHRRCARWRRRGAAGRWRMTSGLCASSGIKPRHEWTEALVRWSSNSGLPVPIRCTCQRTRRCLDENIGLLRGLAGQIQPFAAPVEAGLLMRRAPAGRP